MDALRSLRDIEPGNNNSKYGGEPYKVIGKLERFRQKSRRYLAATMAGTVLVTAFGVAKLHLGPESTECEPVATLTAGNGDTGQTLAERAANGFPGIYLHESGTETSLDHGKPIQPGVPVDVMLCGPESVMENYTFAHTPAVEPNADNNSLNPERSGDNPAITIMEMRAAQPSVDLRIEQGWQAAGAELPR